MTAVAVTRYRPDPLSTVGIALISALTALGVGAALIGRWSDLVAVAVRPALHLGDVPTSWLEVVGFSTGVVTVWLVVRNHVANWPIGIANTMALCALFLDAGLYADGGLQIVYIVIGGYGWWAWLRDGRAGGERTELPLSRTGRSQWVLLAAAVVIGTGVLHLLLDIHTASTVPTWDALTTAISLAATWGQARRKVESWFLWIAVDLIYIPLYLHKDLVLTAGLYLVFLGLCVAGARSWRRELEEAG